MLTAHYLKKSYNSQLIFENVSFNLNSGERVGLVGPNGCGKTTLIKILVGSVSPDSGHVGRSSNLRIGYLPQGFEYQPEATIGQIIGKVAGSAEVLEEEVAEAAIHLAKDPHNRILEDIYDDLLLRIARAESGHSAGILACLGLIDIDPSFPVCHLSGGQKTRLALAQVLLSDPQQLLLDEPTNHLDISMLEWLENWLIGSGCGALIISHDRTFLDRTVTRILEMDSRHRGIRDYPGNYSDYLDQKQSEIEKQTAAYADQQKSIRQMQQDIARTKAQAAYTERQASSVRVGGSDMKLKGFKSYQQGIAKKVAKKAISREKKLDRYIESDERVEKPLENWQMKVVFGGTPHLGRSAIKLEGLCVGYHAERSLLQNLQLEVRAGQRIAITGPNGAGKTTLMRTINLEIKPLAGVIHIGPTVKIGLMSQDQSSLDPMQNALDTLLPYFSNQTETRSFLAYFLFTGDEPLKPNTLLSYGQRARLMLALLVAQKVNVLLLDEPINHLDIPSRTEFEQALSQFDGAVLAVVHDRYFIERFADEVWWVEGGKVTVLADLVGHQSR